MTITFPFITGYPNDPQVLTDPEGWQPLVFFQIESPAQNDNVTAPKSLTNIMILVVQIAMVRPGPIQGDMVASVIYLDGMEGASWIPFARKLKMSLSAQMGRSDLSRNRFNSISHGLRPGFTGGEADWDWGEHTSWKKNGDLYKFKQKLTDVWHKEVTVMLMPMRLFWANLWLRWNMDSRVTTPHHFAYLLMCQPWLKTLLPGSLLCGLTKHLPNGNFIQLTTYQDASSIKCKSTPGLLCLTRSSYDH